MPILWKEYMAEAMYLPGRGRGMYKAEALYPPEKRKKGMDISVKLDKLDREAGKETTKGAKEHERAPGGWCTP